MLDLGFATLLLLSDAALGVDLWATQRPSAAAIVGVAAIVVAGVVVLLVLLRSDEQAPPERPAAPPDLERDLSEVRRCRTDVHRALEQAHGPVRAALVELLDGPLLLLDRRVDELLEASRTLQTGAASADRLAAERADLQAQVEAEHDPRARALLQASLRDVVETERVQADLAQSARLTRLELRRLKTLLASLPVRIQSLDAQHTLDPSGLGDVESIARQLELAVCSSEEVLDAVLPRAEPPYTPCSV